MTADLNPAQIKRATGAWSIASWLLCVPTMWWEGFALATLWAWFLVPLNAPAVTAMHAAGVMLLVRYVRKTFRPRPDVKPAELLSFVRFVTVYSVTGPAMLLLLGWVAKHWM